METYIKYPNGAGYRQYTWGGVATPTVSPTVIVQTAMASTNIPKDVQAKIYSYLKNRGPSSMKKIQSRLKGHSYTCQEIYDFLNAINLIDKSSTQNTISETYTVKI